VEPQTPYISRTSTEEFEERNNKSPHSVNNVVLGTALLWVGWNGFNGGSALAMNLRAVVACASTNLAACAGGVIGLLLQWCWQALSDPDPEGNGHVDINASITAFCDGAIGALVAITPASGYVSTRQPNATKAMY
jgi:ammonia channel protein AmtB